jgi:hypothetical protein
VVMVIIRKLGKNLPVHGDFSGADFSPPVSAVLTH